MRIILVSPSCLKNRKEGGEMFYEWMIRPILFKLYSKDPEEAHEAVLALLSFIGNQKWLAKLVAQCATFEDPALEQEIFGLKFRNPVGLAAGFDKNGVALKGLQSLGFGFIEMGTVTRFEQPGNPRPRIFRFPKNEAIINRMGFPNNGADIVSWQLRGEDGLKIPLGISIGKSKTTPLEMASMDYCHSFRQLYLYGDYFVINVSSPNTPGLRKLQEKAHLKDIISFLKKENKVLAELTKQKPKKILVKISPDLRLDEIDDVLEVCFDCGVDGIIAVNTTITRDGLSVPTIEEGGLSGKPLWPKALAAVVYLSIKINKKIPIIAAGGISNAAQANEMLKYADLIQIYSALVYKGPAIVHQINEGLKDLMYRDGVKNISEIRHGR